MADDARLDELRGQLRIGVLHALMRSHPDSGALARTIADALLPVVSAWAEREAARRTAEELGEALGKAATLGPLEATAWMGRRHAALTPATEEQS